MAIGGSVLAVLAVLVIMVLGIAPASAAAETDLLRRPGAAKRAVDAILKRIGTPPEILSIEITADSLIMQVQGPQRSFHVDRWSYGSTRLFLWRLENIDGPEPMRSQGPVDDVETGFFPLAGLPLERVHEIVAAAIDRAALEEAAAVTSVTIARAISILPEPAYGDVRWTLQVASRSETATVRADAAGQIVGLDLADTLRSKQLDLLRDDDAYVAAGAALTAALGAATKLHRITVYKSYVFVTAEHPADPKLTRDYSWDLGGVRQGTHDTPSFSSLTEQPTFGIGEVDFAVLPRLKAAAKQALAMPAGKVTGLDAEKSAEGIGGPRLEWTVTVTEADGSEGRVTADAAGALLNVLLPENRRPPLDLLHPAQAAAALRKIEAEFGADARYAEILITDDTASVTADDSQAPGRLMEFLMREEGIVRTGAPMFDGEAVPERMFTAADLAVIDAGLLAKLAERTLARLQVDGGKLFRYTIARSNPFVAAPQGLLMIEIRVEDRFGQKSGRVTYASDGREIDVVMP